MVRATVVLAPDCPNSGECVRQRDSQPQDGACRGEPPVQALDAGVSAWGQSRRLASPSMATHDTPTHEEEATDSS